MDYQEFLNAVVECVRKIAGKEADVFIHRVTKNNGIMLDGIVIMKNGNNFSPTIYLNSYYSMYLSGCEINDIAYKVYDIYKSCIGNVKIPEDFFMSFDRLRENIAFRVINYDRNRELLRSIPHRKFKNLAIVYFAVIDDIENERGIVTIYNNHIAHWNVSEDILYSYAMKNTPRLYQAEIKPMNQVVSDMILKESREENIDEMIAHVNRMNEEFPMYVLTNSYRSYGASCMLYEGLLMGFASHIEADLYIVPSSVHEVILIPVDDDITKDGLDEMVRSVNSTELSKEEILSDSAYLFTRENGFE